MKKLVVIDIQAALTERLDMCSGLVEFVRPGRTWSVVWHVVEAGLSKQLAVGGQSAVEEPVVGRQIGFGMFVGVVRLVGSQFVEEQAVGGFVADLVVGCWAAFGWRTQSERRRAWEMGLSSPSDPWSCLYGSHVDSRL